MYGSRHPTTQHSPTALVTRLVLSFATALPTPTLHLHSLLPLCTYHLTHTRRNTLRHTAQSDSLCSNRRSIRLTLTPFIHPLDHNRD